MITVVFNELVTGGYVRQHWSEDIKAVGDSESPLCLSRILAKSNTEFKALAFAC